LIQSFISADRQWKHQKLSPQVECQRIIRLVQFLRLSGTDRATSATQNTN